MRDFSGRILQSRRINYRKSFLVAVLVALIVLGLKIQAAGEERHARFILQGFQKTLSDYHRLNGHYPKEFKAIPRFLAASAGENFYFDSQSLKEKRHWRAYEFRYQLTSENHFILTASPRIGGGLRKLSITEEGSQ